MSSTCVGYAYFIAFYCVQRCSFQVYFPEILHEHQEYVYIIYLKIGSLYNSYFLYSKPRPWFTGAILISWLDFNSFRILHNQLISTATASNDLNICPILPDSPVLPQHFLLFIILDCRFSENSCMRNQSFLINHSFP